MSDLLRIENDEDFRKVVEYNSASLRTQGAGTINENIALKFYDCSLKERSLTVSVETNDWMSNPWGSLHGGIIVSVFDQCMGVAAYCFNGQRMTQTLSLNTSYLRPGTLGQRFFVKTRLTKTGNTLQYLTAEAWSEDRPDKLVATASGIYYASRQRRQFGG